MERNLWDHIPLELLKATHSRRDIKVLEEYFEKDSYFANSDVGDKIRHDIDEVASEPCCQRFLQRVNLLLGDPHTEDLTSLFQGHALEFINDICKSEKDANLHLYLPEVMQHCQIIYTFNGLLDTEDGRKDYFDFMSKLVLEYWKSFFLPSKVNGLEQEQKLVYVALLYLYRNEGTIMDLLFKLTFWVENLHKSQINSENLFNLIRILFLRTIVQNSKYVSMNYSNLTLVNYIRTFLLYKVLKHLETEAASFQSNEISVHLVIGYSIESIVPHLLLVPSQLSTVLPLLDRVLPETKISLFTDKAKDILLTQDFYIFERLAGLLDFVKQYASQIDLAGNFNPKSLQRVRYNRNCSNILSSCNIEVVPVLRKLPHQCENDFSVLKKSEAKNKFNKYTPKKNTFNETRTCLDTRENLFLNMDTFENVVHRVLDTSSFEQVGRMVQSLVTDASDVSVKTCKYATPTQEEAVEKALHQPAVRSNSFERKSFTFPTRNAFSPFGQESPALVEPVKYFETPSLFQTSNPFKAIRNSFGSSSSPQRNSFGCSSTPPRNSFGSSSTPPSTSFGSSATPPAFNTNTPSSSDNMLFSNFINNPSSLPSSFYPERKLEMSVIGNSKLEVFSGFGRSNDDIDELLQKIEKIDLKEEKLEKSLRPSGLIIRPSRINNIDKKAASILSSNKNLGTESRRTTLPKSSGLPTQSSCRRDSLPRSRQSNWISKSSSNPFLCTNNPTKLFSPESSNSLLRGIRPKSFEELSNVPSLGLEGSFRKSEQSTSLNTKESEQLIFNISYKQNSTPKLDIRKQKHNTNQPNSAGTKSFDTSHKNNKEQPEKVSLIEKSVQEPVKVLPVLEKSVEKVPPIKESDILPNLRDSVEEFCPLEERSSKLPIFDKSNKETCPAVTNLPDTFEDVEGLMEVIEEVVVMDDAFTESLLAGVEPYRPKTLSDKTGSPANCKQMEKEVSVSCEVQKDLGNLSNAVNNQLPELAESAGPQMAELNSQEMISTKNKSDHSHEMRQSSTGGFCATPESNSQSCERETRPLITKAQSSVTTESATQQNRTIVYLESEENKAKDLSKKIGETIESRTDASLSEIKKQSLDLHAPNGFIDKNSSLTVNDQQDDMTKSKLCHKHIEKSTEDIQTSEQQLDRTPNVNKASQIQTSRETETPILEAPSLVSNVQHLNMLGRASVISSSVENIVSEIVKVAENMEKTDYHSSDEARSSELSQFESEDNCTLNMVDQEEDHCTSDMLDQEDSHCSPAMLDQEDEEDHCSSIMLGQKDDHSPSSMLNQENDHCTSMLGQKDDHSPSSMLDQEDGHYSSDMLDQEDDHCPSAMLDQEDHGSSIMLGQKENHSPSRMLDQEDDHYTSSILGQKEDSTYAEIEPDELILSSENCPKKGSVEMHESLSDRIQVNSKESVKVPSQDKGSTAKLFDTSSDFLELEVITTLSKSPRQSTSSDESEGKEQCSQKTLLETNRDQEIVANKTHIQDNVNKDAEEQEKDVNMGNDDHASQVRLDKEKNEIAFEGRIVDETLKAQTCDKGKEKGNDKLGIQEEKGSNQEYNGIEVDLNSQDKQSEDSLEVGKECQEESSTMFTDVQAEKEHPPNVNSIGIQEKLVTPGNKIEERKEKDSSSTKRKSKLNSQNKLSRQDTLLQTDLIKQNQKSLEKEPNKEHIKKDQSSPKEVHHSSNKILKSVSFEETDGLSQKEEHSSKSISKSRDQKYEVKNKKCPSNKLGDNAKPVNNTNKSLKTEDFSAISQENVLERLEDKQNINEKSLIEDEVDSHDDLNTSPVVETIETTVEHDQQSKESLEKLELERDDNSSLETPKQMCKKSTNSSCEIEISKKSEFVTNNGRIIEDSTENSKSVGKEKSRRDFCENTCMESSSSIEDPSTSLIFTIPSPHSKSFENCLESSRRRKNRSHNKRRRSSNKSENESYSDEVDSNDPNTSLVFTIPTTDSKHDQQSKESLEKLELEKDVRNSSSLETPKRTCKRLTNSSSENEISKKSKNVTNKDRIIEDLAENSEPLSKKKIRRESCENTCTDSSSSMEDPNTSLIFTIPSPHSKSFENCLENSRRIKDQSHKRRRSTDTSENDSYSEEVDSDDPNTSLVFAIPTTDSKAFEKCLEKSKREEEKLRNKKLLKGRKKTNDSLIEGRKSLSSESFKLEKLYNEIKTYKRKLDHGKTKVNSYQQHVNNVKKTSLTLNRSTDSISLEKNDKEVLGEVQNSVHFDLATKCQTQTKSPSENFHKEKSCMAENLQQRRKSSSLTKSATDTIPLKKSSVTENFHDRRKSSSSIGNLNDRRKSSSSNEQSRHSDESSDSNEDIALSDRLESPNLGRKHRHDPNGYGLIVPFTKKQERFLKNHEKSKQSKLVKYDSNHDTLKDDCSLNFVAVDSKSIEVRAEVHNNPEENVSSSSLESNNHTTPVVLNDSKNSLYDVSSKSEIKRTKTSSSKPSNCDSITKDACSKNVEKSSEVLSKPPKKSLGKTPVKSVTKLCEIIRTEIIQERESRMKMSQNNQINTQPTVSQSEPVKKQRGRPRINPIDPKEPRNNTTDNFLLKHSRKRKRKRGSTSKEYPTKDRLNVSIGLNNLEQDEQLRNMLSSRQHMAIDTALRKTHESLRVNSSHHLSEEDRDCQAPSKPEDCSVPPSQGSTTRSQESNGRSQNSNGPYQESNGPSLESNGRSQESKGPSEKNKGLSQESKGAHICIKLRCASDSDNCKEKKKRKYKSYFVQETTIPVVESNSPSGNQETSSNQETCFLGNSKRQETKSESETIPLLTFDTFDRSDNEDQTCTFVQGKQDKDRRASTLSTPRNSVEEENSEDETVETIEKFISGYPNIKEADKDDTCNRVSDPDTFVCASSCAKNNTEQKFPESNESPGNDVDLKEQHSRTYDSGYLSEQTSESNPVVQMMSYSSNFDQTFPHEETTTESNRELSHNSVIQQKDVNFNTTQYNCNIAEETMLSPLAESNVNVDLEESRESFASSEWNMQSDNSVPTYLSYYEYSHTVEYCTSLKQTTSTNETVSSPVSRAYEASTPHSSNNSNDSNVATPLNDKSREYEFHSGELNEVRKENTGGDLSNLNNASASANNEALSTFFSNFKASKDQFEQAEPVHHQCASSQTEQNKRSQVMKVQSGENPKTHATHGTIFHLRKSSTLDVPSRTDGNHGSQGSSSVKKNMIRKHKNSGNFSSDNEMLGITQKAMPGVSKEVAFSDLVQDKNLPVTDGFPSLFLCDVNDKIPQHDEFINTAVLLGPADDKLFEESSSSEVSCTENLNQIIASLSDDTNSCDTNKKKKTSKSRQNSGCKQNHVVTKAMLKTHESKVETKSMTNSWDQKTSAPENNFMSDKNSNSLQLNIELGIEMMSNSEFKIVKSSVSSKSSTENSYLDTKKHIKTEPETNTVYQHHPSPNHIQPHHNYHQQETQNLLQSHQTDSHPCHVQQHQNMILQQNRHLENLQQQQDPQHPHNHQPQSNHQQHDTQQLLNNHPQQQQQQQQQNNRHHHHQQQHNHHIQDQQRQLNYQQQLNHQSFEQQSTTQQNQHPTNQIKSQKSNQDSVPWIINHYNQSNANLDRVEPANQGNHQNKIVYQQGSNNGRTTPHNKDRISSPDRLYHNRSVPNNTENSVLANCLNQRTDKEYQTPPPVSNRSSVNTSPKPNEHMYPSGQPQSHTNYVHQKSHQQIYNTALEPMVSPTKNTPCAPKRYVYSTNQSVNTNLFVKPPPNTNAVKSNFRNQKQNKAGSLLRKVHQKKLLEKQLMECQHDPNATAAAYTRTYANIQPKPQPQEHLSTQTAQNASLDPNQAQQATQTLQNATVDPNRNANADSREVSGTPPPISTEPNQMIVAKPNSPQQTEEQPMRIQSIIMKTNNQNMSVTRQVDASPEKTQQYEVTYPKSSAVASVATEDIGPFMTDHTFNTDYSRIYGTNESVTPYETCDTMVIESNVQGFQGVLNPQTTVQSYSSVNSVIIQQDFNSIIIQQDPSQTLFHYYEPYTTTKSISYEAVTKNRNGVLDIPIPPANRMMSIAEVLANPDCNPELQFRLKAISSSKVGK